jgi:hypothetical protein
VRPLPARTSRGIFPRFDIPFMRTFGQRSGVSEVSAVAGHRVRWLCAKTLELGIGHANDPRRTANTVRNGTECRVQGCNHRGMKRGNSKKEKDHATLVQVTEEMAQRRLTKSARKTKFAKEKKSNRRQTG